jgi:hypothetical protein
VPVRDFAKDGSVAGVHEELVALSKRLKRPIHLTVHPGGEEGPGRIEGLLGSRWCKTDTLGQIMDELDAVATEGPRP